MIRNPYVRESQQVDAQACNPEYIPLWEMFAVMDHLGLYSGKWWANADVQEVRQGLAKLAGGHPVKFRELEDLLALAASL